MFKKQLDEKSLYESYSLNSFFLLFNGISAFMGYIMPNLSMQKNSSDTI